MQVLRAVSVYVEQPHEVIMNVPLINRTCRLHCVCFTCAYRHQRRKHSSQLMAENPDSVIQCGLCPRTFVNVAALRRHAELCNGAGAHTTSSVDSNALNDIATPTAATSSRRRQHSSSVSAAFGSMFGGSSSISSSSGSSNSSGSGGRRNALDSIGSGRGSGGTRDEDVELLGTSDEQIDLTIGFQPRTYVTVFCSFPNLHVWIKVQIAASLLCSYVCAVPCNPIPSELRDDRSTSSSSSQPSRHSQGTRRRVSWAAQIIREMRTLPDIDDDGETDLRTTQRPSVSRRNPTSDAMHRYVSMHIAQCRSHNKRTRSIISLLLCLRTVILAA